jgi:hypothetical protein
MKIINKKIIATVAALGILTTAAEATPAFAKQMNAECMSCHYQNIPKLNSFGRDFKMSGFTMTGGVPEVTGNHLSIPATFNLGFVSKSRIANDTDAAGSTTQEVQIYDESALLFGGKLGENMGASFEFGGPGKSISGSGNTAAANMALSGKILYSKEFSFGRLGGGVYNTDALGVFAATEIMTTGLYRPVRQFENRKAANIFQKLGLGAGEATGLTAFYYGNGLFVSVAQYLPAMAPAADMSHGLNTAVRAVYTADVAGWNVSLGGFSLSGDTTTAATSGTVAESDRTASGVDLQVEGEVAGMSLMVTSALAIENKFNKNVAGVYGTDNGGFDINAQLNVQEHLGVKLAYLSYDDKSSNNADSSTMSIGTNWSMYQNVDLVAEYSVTTISGAASGAKDPTSLLLMAEIAF